MSSQTAAGTQQQDEGMQGMHGKMHQGQHEQMSGMMQECHKNMQSMMSSNEQTRKDVQAARQSNDPAKMRAALDEAEKALTATNECMNKCSGMMQKMHGMHGKSDQQNQPPR